MRALITNLLRKKSGKSVHLMLFIIITFLEILESGYSFYTLYNCVLKLKNIVLVFSDSKAI